MECISTGRTERNAAFGVRLAQQLIVLETHVPLIGQVRLDEPPRHFVMVAMLELEYQVILGVFHILCNLKCGGKVL